MKIKLICPGKLKESFMRDACGEYLKRLGRYANVSVIEVADEKTPDAPSDVQRQMVLKKEGERILSHIGDRDHVIALCIEGRFMSSEAFSDAISRLRDSGRDITFVIGGSLGLWEGVTDRSDMRLSFSPMTFPHQLMRVILLEQIYRGFRIISGEPYHK